MRSRSPQSWPPLSVAACLVVCALAPNTGSANDARRNQRRPNIVIIFTDDQGYHDVGCYGSPDIETPNLDRMAREGCRFTDFYVAAPSCTPSRTALLTGCYPQRVSLPHVLGPKSEIGIHDDELTIAEVFKAEGYATACFGKWHLGHHAQFLPTRHGFDRYFGLPYSNDMWPHHPRAQKGTYPDLPLVEGDKTIELNPDQSQLTTWYTERAVNFIRTNKDRPFFLYVPHTMPHVPLFVSDKYRGKSPRGLYGDVISEIDWSVGEILVALRENGVDHRTLVIFSSDNGPWLAYHEDGGSALPLREGKATSFEGGMRVPCIMRFPGKVPAGHVVTEMATAMDILPTVARLTGAELPSDRIIDGRDIWPLVTAQPGAKTPHEAFFYYVGRELQAVRSGKWKLHFPHRYRTRFINRGREVQDPRAVREIGLALFDLETDVREEYDVAEHYPDVVARLTALAEKCRAELGDSRENEKRTGAGVRPPGRI